MTLPVKNGQRRSPVEGEGNCRALLYEKIFLLAKFKFCFIFMALVYHSYLMIVWIIYELSVNILVQKNGKITFLFPNILKEKERGTLFCLMF